MLDSKHSIDIGGFRRWFGARAGTARAEYSVDRSAETDETIITRLLSTKDPAHFAIIVTRYRNKLSALARTSLSGTAAAAEVEDIVQDAFVSAYDNLKTFREGSAFRPWLYRIVINRCIDRLRQLRHLVDGVDIDLMIDDRERGPLESALMKDEARRINAAVLSLPANLRIIFLLRHMENLSYDDMAKATGLPEGTVKTHLFRARARIREILQEDKRT